MTTLITVTTAVAVASESSSEPGCRKAEKTRATIRVDAGEEGRAPGAGPGRRGGPPGVGVAAPAPRGSGRRSAASSRPRGRGPSSCRRRARGRRSSSPELSSASTPRPAKTVRAPKASGIAAATTERKTSSRTRISSGAASSSARSVELERFLLQGPGDGGEARLGGDDRRVDPRLQRRVPAPAPSSRIASSSGTWKSTKTRALSRAGPQRRRRSPGPRER